MDDESDHDAILRRRARLLAVGLAGITLLAPTRASAQLDASDDAPALDASADTLADASADTLADAPTELRFDAPQPCLSISQSRCACATPGARGRVDAWFALGAALATALGRRRLARR